MTFNRREFLVTTVAAAAVPSHLRALPGDSGPIKLSVATYSLRKFKRPEAIKMIKELGIKFADVKDFHIPIKDATEQDWKQGGNDFREAGIKIVACGNIDMKKPEDHERAFQYAKAIGSPCIVCAPTAEALPNIERLAKQYKTIKIAIHNHGPEDKFMPTPESVLDAVKNMDPLMGLCLDVGHTARTGADPVEWIAKAGPRLHETHFKDLKDPHNKDWKVARDSQVDVGDGVLPIKQCLAQLAKQKYAGYCSLEYEINADNPLPGMKKSFDYMRKCITELKLA